VFVVAWWARTVAVAFVGRAGLGEVPPRSGQADSAVGSATDAVGVVVVLAVVSQRQTGQIW
jgi:hypothetical protein